jgi:hypothetical protein
MARDLAPAPQARNWPGWPPEAAAIAVEGQRSKADKNTNPKSKICILPGSFMENDIFIDLFILSFFSGQLLFFL